ncbi:TlpA disulfide reductase family protein [Sanyastnella coralliicola]|uniref:TlpA disulfide reductase family protein n=1 Tax=Sanyastnella coralliicola TaxID=3069118 RepID=UPI0027B8D0B1|nr:TlpA disulfide reductase family protein [Longitalea sp. SCSIO 12813]
MTKKLLYIIGASALFAACSAGPQTGISGNIKGAAGEMIYLERFVNNRAVATDSALIAEDGSFSIVPQQGMDLNFYQLKIDDERRLVFLSDSTEALHVTADSEDIRTTLQFSGSRHSQLLDEFQDAIRPLEMQLIDLRKISQDAGKSQEERSQAFQQQVDLQNEKRSIALKFIEDNSTSPASLAALNELNLKQDLDKYKKVADDLKTSFGHSYYYKMVTSQIDNAGKQQAAGGQQQAPKNSKYTTGMDAPDIAMSDPDGNVMKLSDLRGKVVMIDFWASWCGPCRRENPNVVKAYEKYNPKGFEIFSVSLDKDVERWKAAIAQDGLLWPNHVSDLQGWKNAASQAYGVSSIPHTILVGRDGKIVATHLRGAQLEAKLAELFES